MHTTYIYYLVYYTHYHRNQAKNEMDTFFWDLAHSWCLPVLRVFLIKLRSNRYWQRYIIRDNNIHCIERAYDSLVKKTHYQQSLMCFWERLGIVVGDNAGIDKNPGPESVILCFGDERGFGEVEFKP